MKKFPLIAAASVILPQRFLPVRKSISARARVGSALAWVIQTIWRHRHWRDSYAFDRDDCRVIRERIITPSGA